jgi:hypothetical protein
MRAKAAIFVNNAIALLGKPADDGMSCRLWAANETGRLGMRISATFK